MKFLKTGLKNFLLALFLISILFSLSGCKMDINKSIDELEYVIALGIDLGDYESIKLSFQFSTVESSEGGSSSSGSSSQSSSSIINTVDCSSIDSGISLLNTYINKTIELSHCRAIIISEEVAAKGVSQYIYTLINKVDIRPDCNIFICKGLAKDYLNNSKPQEENAASRYYNIEKNFQKNNGFTENVTLNDFFLRLNDSFGQPYAVLTSVNSNSTQDDDTESSVYDLAGDTKIESKETHVQTMGLAVFKGEVLVGELDGIETVSHLLLVNDLGSCTISIPDPFNSNDNIDLYINMRKNTSIKVDLINNSPLITCRVKINARILSLNDTSKELDEQKIERIEQYANKYLEEQLYNYLYKTSKEYKSDIVGFGKYVVSRFLTWEEWTDYNWLNNYQNSSFKVEVDTNVKSGYLIMES